MGSWWKSVRFSPSFVLALVALVVASNGVAFALGVGVVKTKNIADGAVTTAKLANKAVVSSKVKPRSLHVSDLGGVRSGTQTLSATSVAAGTCTQFLVYSWLSHTDKVVGGMVYGYLTDADGTTPVLDNKGVVVPTMISETSQGGAIANLLVCATTQQDIPDGALLHYTVVAP